MLSGEGESVSPVGSTGPKSHVCSAGNVCPWGPLQSPHRSGELILCVCGIFNLGSGWTGVCVGKMRTNLKPDHQCKAGGVVVWWGKNQMDAGYYPCSIIFIGGCLKKILAWGPLLRFESGGGGE